MIVVPHNDMPLHGWVTVQDSYITAIGRGRRDAQNRQSVIEGHGGALLPGFVNTHAHSHSSLTRGSAEGLPLEGWIAVIEREQINLTDEQAYVGALATYAEAMLSGTTCIVDMCIRSEPALAAARDIGIRAVIVPYVPTQSRSLRRWNKMLSCWSASMIAMAECKSGWGCTTWKAAATGQFALALNSRTPTVPGCTCIVQNRVSRSNALGRESAEPRLLTWLNSARSMPAPCWHTASGRRRKIARCSPPRARMLRDMRADP